MQCFTDGKRISPNSFGGVKVRCFTGPKRTAPNPSEGVKSTMLYAVKAFWGGKIQYFTDSKRSMPYSSEWVKVKCSTCPVGSAVTLSIGVKVQ